MKCTSKPETTSQRNWKLPDKLHASLRAGGTPEWAVADDGRFRLVVKTFADVDEDPNSRATYASPPCFMHELEPACGGFGKTEDPALRSDVMRWRKAERTAERLDALLVDVAGLVVSGYWPIKKGNRIVGTD